MHAVGGEPGHDVCAEGQLRLTSKPEDVPAVLRPAAALADSMFSMVVLALSSETVSAPPGFPEAEDFLVGHEMEVNTGLNVDSALKLDEWGLWPIFENWGYTEKEIVATGFLGWNATWHIGKAVGSNAGSMYRPNESSW